MIIDGIEHEVIDVYDLSVTVPDSFVVNDNKTCGGHGEAKLYMGSKEHMRAFYSGNANSSGFRANCIVLKEDLLQYMQTIAHEYQNPSITYRGQGKRKDIMHLWNQRIEMINKLPSSLRFHIKDQNQIVGNRGYVKTTGKTTKGGYGIIREISLPFVTYLSVMKLKNTETGELFFYWKLFTDFSQMAEQQYLAKNYGKGKRKILGRVRDGQMKYRQSLYSLFKHCPFSKIDDARLLIASHIKPWAVCTQTEKTDLSNGLMLSPLYDKLFDRGFISFTDNGELLISDWLSPQNKKRISFEYSPQDLFLNDNRKKYLEYHRKNVFK